MNIAIYISNVIRKKFVSHILLMKKNKEYNVSISKIALKLKNEKPNELKNFIRIKKPGS